MKSVRVTYFFLFSYLLSSLLIWNKSTVAQSVESSSRVDNHNSLEQNEEYIVPGNANKSSLRSLQQSAGCNYPCNFSRYCAGWNGACPFCVNNQCLPTTTPVCGTTCKTNSHCYGGSNGCTSCVQNVCKAVQCGAYCTNDSMCSGATGCNYCANNVCASSRSPSTGCGISCQGDYACSGTVCTRCLNGYCAQPQCGLYCYNNNGCSSAANGCTTCLSNGNGNSVCSVAPQCGSSCTNNNQCYGASNSCTTCTSGRCVQDNNNSNNACVSTFNGLMSAASGSSDTVTLCASSQITLSAQLLVNRNGAFTLQCATGGSCTIDGNGRFATVISASTISISGINFTNGYSSSNGGAITISSTYSTTFQASRIQYCSFQNNKAVLTGGAVYVNGYADIINCSGSNNQAAQCNAIYQSSAGTCTALY